MPALKSKPNIHQLFSSALPFHPKTKRIRICALDGDDCFLPNWHALKKIVSMFEHNQVFVETLSKDAKEAVFDEVIFASGSSRKNIISDLNAMLQFRQNSKNETVCKAITDSLFLSLKTFVDTLRKHFTEHNISTPIRLDNTLLPDLLYDQIYGSTFSEALTEKALQQWFNYGKENDNFVMTPEKTNAMIKGYQKVLEPLLKKSVEDFCATSKQDLQDTSKFAWLYGLMHKHASENPDAEIDFHFYEDNLIIINQLLFLLNDTPSLIPRNMKFHVHCYQDGEQVRDPDTKLDAVITIHGTGVIDTEFHLSIKTMAEEFIKTQTTEEKTQWSVVGNVARLYCAFETEADGYVVGGKVTKKLSEFCEQRDKRLATAVVASATASMGVSC